MSRTRSEEAAWAAAEASRGRAMGPSGPARSAKSGLAVLANWGAWVKWSDAVN